MSVRRGHSWFAWALAALLALGLGIGLAVWLAPSTVDVPLPAQRDAGSPRPPVPAPPTLAAPASPTMPVAPAAPAVAVPPGVTSAQWRALQSELAGRPHELQRLADYLTYADQLQRFRTLAGPSAERAALARALDAGLDARLQRREMHAGEARLVKIAVLDVLVEGDAPRRQALAAWEARVARAAPTDDAAQAAARNAEFKQRQAERLAAWSAMPPGQRDPRELERQLDALRQAQFPPAR
jgi:hypothetical protein